MSDLMFYGVLRMPYEMAMSDELSRRQFYARAQQAADRVAAAEAALATHQPVDIRAIAQAVVDAVTDGFVSDPDVDASDYHAGKLAGVTEMKAALRAALAASAPMHTAAHELPALPIKTWRERKAADSGLHDETHMEDEIADLRAALGGRNSGQTVAWIRRHPDGKLTGELLMDAVIEPVRKSSGAWVPLGVLPLALDPLVLRAQGRAEALDIILNLEPETALEDCMTSHSLADTGDYTTHWSEKKLRELLKVDQADYNAFDKAEAAYWESLGERDEARHAAALARNAPGCAKLRSYLCEQNQIGLLHELMTQEPFQARVQPWLLECFGADIAADQMERNHRFLEESLELAQACGCTAAEAHQLVNYVFGRDVGESAQEVGGVMVTLAALCLAQGLDMAAAGETELARIWTKVEAIRAKQAAKPKYGPLPGPAPADAACEICDGTRVAFGKRCKCAQGAEL